MPGNFSCRWYLLGLLLLLLTLTVSQLLCVPPSCCLPPPFGCLWPNTVVATVLKQTSSFQSRLRSEHGKGWREGSQGQATPNQASVALSLPNPDAGLSSTPTEFLVWCMVQICLKELFLCSPQVSLLKVRNTKGQSCIPGPYFLLHLPPHSNFHPCPCNT